MNTGFNMQQTALAEAHGRIAQLPNHGDISLALGGDYRKASGGFTPDPLTSTGALFRTVNGIAARGTYSTAFRAPSIGELFAGAADDFQSAEDPCDTNPPSTGPRVLDPTTEKHCMDQGVPTGSEFGTTQQRAIAGGNPRLKAETARVATVGVVFEPPQVKGLSFTLDYWRIQIEDAIQVLGATAIFANCYTREVASYCEQIHRDPISHQIDSVDNPVANVGGTTTTGSTSRSPRTASSMAWAACARRSRRSTCS